MVAAGLDLPWVATACIKQDAPDNGVRNDIDLVEWIDDASQCAFALMPGLAEECQAVRIACVGVMNVSHSYEHLVSTNTATRIVVIQRSRLANAEARRPWLLV